MSNSNIYQTEKRQKHMANEQLTCYKKLQILLAGNDMGHAKHTKMSTIKNPDHVHPSLFDVNTTFIFLKIKIKLTKIN